MTTAATAAAGSCDLSSAAGGRVWTPRPWRAECRRTDLRRVGRFAHERALRDAGIDLSPGAHHVVSVLASYGNEHGANIFPSQETLARVCRRSARHVRSKLRELSELGLVRRLSHGGGRPSHQGGRTRRVTPARYELTLPTSLTDDPDTSRTVGDDDDAAGRRPAPTPKSAPSRRSAHEPSAPVDTQSPAETGGELSAQVVEQIRETLGVHALTDQQADAAIAAAVARAPGAVTNRLSYALTVIRSDPSAFRPNPEVTEPDCPRHPGHPTTRCPPCATARSGPTPAWKQMRAALRRPRAP